MWRKLITAVAARADNVAGEITSAKSASEVTHALTLRGGQLTWAITQGIKVIENRTFAIKPGWIALHTGEKHESVESQRMLLAGLLDVPPEAELPHSAIVGAIHISHHLTLEQSRSDPWAFGKVCNVIDARVCIDHPVPHKGSLDLWPIAGDVVEDLRAQLAAATVLANNIAHLPPAPGTSIASNTAATNTAATRLVASNATAAPPTSATVPAAVVATPAPAALAPAAVGAERKRKAKGNQMSESVRAEAHQRQLNTSFESFECKCNLATAAGAASCLDQFSKAQLKGFYAETYGSGSGGNANGGNANSAKRVKLRDVSTALHTHMWALKVEREEVSAHGAQYEIPKWTLDGKEVCREAWRHARGGSSRRHRDIYCMVRRGHGPAERAAGKLARLETALLQRQADCDNARKIWTVNWWAEELLLHEWLPNEHAVRFRGQGFGFLHKSLYRTLALAANIKPLSYKPWRKDCVQGALIQLHEQNKLPGSDIKKLRLKRSAKHSAFPECTTCQERRKAYEKAAKARGADPAVVQRAYQALLEHMQEWGDDRKAALRLKYGTYHGAADAIYECDDGCGSFWQGLPVDPTGRDSKKSVNAKYKFCVQANVICGPGGLQRFAVMPKNVRKGANFGLSNFILVLHRAWKSGRLGPHVTRAYRHTDGGPDNVSWVSHLLHWLLIFIGVFQDLEWFRFEAGHSHTEIADRLFAVMKELFESDTTTRVGPLESFADLEMALRSHFDKADEHFELAFHLANWDFEKWFNSFEFDHDSTFTSSKKLVDPNFAGYSFDHVFRYEYVGEALWQHGGVKVCRIARAKPEK